MINLDDEEPLPEQQELGTMGHPVYQRLNDEVQILCSAMGRPKKVSRHTPL